MKKSDIAMLILIIGVSALLSYFVGNLIFGGSVSKPVDVETVPKVSSEVAKPSADIFNTNSINPTIPITIGNQATR